MSGTPEASARASRQDGPRDIVRHGAVACEHTHPSWVRFIRYCEDLKFGELTRLQIQDGLPISAEYVKKKVKFT